jgi:hypothetical protein
MATNPKVLTKEERVDVKLATSLILNPLLQDEGISALQEAAQSASDLPAALALAIFQAMGQVKSAIQQKGVPLSSKIWVANGGVLDTVVQNVCQALASVPPEIPEAAEPDFMQDVKEEVFSSNRTSVAKTKSRTLRSSRLPKRRLCS